MKKVYLNLKMKKIFYLILFFTVLLHLIFGLWWLAISWGIVWLVVWLYYTPIKVIAKFRKITFLVYPLMLIGAILLAIILKTLFFGIYKIPSGSMEKTIVPGDIVWVNNLRYGPRLPYSPYEISWINGLVWLLEGKNADLEKKWWKYKRLKGYSSPKRGDIAVFNHPFSNNIYIKRIAALPGDTLQISDGILYINGREQNRPENSLYYSKVTFKNSDEAVKILDSMKISMSLNTKNVDSIFYTGNILSEDFVNLKSHPKVTDASYGPLFHDTTIVVYPYTASLNWNINNYGPYILPYKGMVVKKTSDNLHVFGQLINHESQFRPEAERDSCGHFTFYNDYYFMLGDNFHDSEDSRYFGPVREEFLIGKASFIIYSKSSKFLFPFKKFKRLKS